MRLDHPSGDLDRADHGEDVAHGRTHGVRLRREEIERRFPGLPVAGPPR